MRAGKKLTVLGGRWTPRALFAGGKVGVWYDASDLSTLFTDTAGTTPVTADGDAVALILDKSGNGKHLTQATPSSRAKYRTSGGLRWLEFDGTDDSYASNAAIDFSGSDEILVAAGAYKATDTGTLVLAELSASRSANNGSFSLFVPNSAAGVKYQYIPHGSADPGTPPTTSSASYAAPNTVALRCEADISLDLATLSLNGSLITTGSGDIGTGNFGNYTLYVGRRNNTSFPYNGRIHQLIVRSGLPTGSEAAQLDRFIAAKSGVSM